MKNWQTPKLMRHGSFEAMTQQFRTKIAGLSDGFAFNGVTPICEPGVNCQVS